MLQVRALSVFPTVSSLKRESPIVAGVWLRIWFCLRAPEQPRIISPIVSTIWESIVEVALNAARPALLLRKGITKTNARNTCEIWDMRRPQLNNYDNDKTIVGCGLCQTKVPCEFQNPGNHLEESRAQVN